MTRVGVLVTLLCASCVQSGEVHCDDGRLCPPGYTCDNDNHRCLSPDQLAACDGQPDGAACTVAGATGACQMGACEPLVCGDGLRSFGEACDGADLGGADCTTAGYYNPDGLACTAFCTFDVSACTEFCGDNKLNGPELCDGTAPAGTCFDLGFDAGPLGCAASCGYSFASCGRFGWVAEGVPIAQVLGFAGTSSTDLWVVGQRIDSTNAIAHYDGAGWTVQPTGSTDDLLAIAAITPSDAWIATAGAGVGQPATPMHFDGTQWSTPVDAPAADYTDVWAASSTAVYFASRDAGVKWWNGSAWQTLGSLSAPIVDIDGSSDTDIWAAQADGTLQHWNGSAWQPINVPVLVRHIDVRAANSVWVVGPSTAVTAAAVAHFDGTMFTTYTDQSLSTEAFVSVLAIADNDVWVAGPLGQVRHFNGQHWIDSASRVTTDSIASFSVMQKIGDVVYGAAFNGFIHRYRGQLMGRMGTGSATPVSSIWSANPSATFIGDLRGGVLRYNGQIWTRDVVDAMQQSFAALWGSGSSDVWASGSSGRVYRYNGSGWTFPTTIGSVNTIWGTGPNDVWFFGSSATHYNGSMFVPVTTGASLVSAASGSGPNDIWLLDPITTVSTRVVRWNGTAWSSTVMPNDMTAIVALGPDNVFVAADNNHILHYNGTAWTDTSLPISSRLVYIAASASDDVVAASTTEAVHFDGKSWTPLRVPLEGGMIRGITVAPAHIDFLLSNQAVRRLVRTRFWSCRASEAGCNDGVDDDCDGDVDLRDSDC